MIAMIDIRWDAEKCTSPQECRACLDACPQGVFRIFPRDGRKPGKVTEDWTIGPLFLSLCTGCEVCSDVCPKQAITVAVA